MITSFTGEFVFLSNFASSPIVIRGKVWSTVEHVYQAIKTCDKQRREKIRLASTPGKAKRMGRRVECRPDWEEIKQKVMLKSVRLKFKQNPKLAQKLINTGDQILIEGNRWHDNTWGDCSCGKCGYVQGKNLLGKILMQVRSEIVKNEALPLSTGRS